MDALKAFHSSMFDYPLLAREDYQSGSGTGRHWYRYAGSAAVCTVQNWRMIRSRDRDQPCRLDLVASDSFNRRKYKTRKFC